MLGVKHGVGAKVDVRPWIELLMASTLLVGLGGVIWHRIKTQKGMSARVIQFVAVAMLIPTLVILSLEKILDGSTVGTIIGGIVGYLLSGISSYDKSQGDV